MMAYVIVTTSVVSLSAIAISPQYVTLYVMRYWHAVNVKLTQ